MFTLVFARNKNEETWKSQQLQIPAVPLITSDPLLQACVSFFSASKMKPPSPPPIPLFFNILGVSPSCVILPGKITITSSLKHHPKGCLGELNRLHNWCTVAHKNKWHKQPRHMILYSTLFNTLASTSPVTHGGQSTPFQYPNSDWK